MPAPWMGTTQSIFPGRVGPAHMSTFLPKTSSRLGDVSIRGAAQVCCALSSPQVLTFLDTAPSQFCVPITWLLCPGHT